MGAAPRPSSALLTPPPWFHLEEALSRAEARQLAVAMAARGLQERLAAANREACHAYSRSPQRSRVPPARRRRRAAVAGAVAGAAGGRRRRGVRTMLMRASSRRSGSPRQLASERRRRIDDAGRAGGACRAPLEPRRRGRRLRPTAGPFRRGKARRTAGDRSTRGPAARLEDVGAKTRDRRARRVNRGATGRSRDLQPAPRRMKKRRRRKIRAAAAARRRARRRGREGRRWPFGPLNALQAAVLEVPKGWFVASLKVAASVRPVRAARSCACRAAGTSAPLGRRVVPRAGRPVVAPQWPFVSQQFLR